MESSERNDFNDTALYFLDTAIVLQMVNSAATVIVIIVPIILTMNKREVKLSG
jgi:hypothetical protein